MFIVDYVQNRLLSAPGPVGLTVVASWIEPRDTLEPFEEDLVHSFILKHFPVSCGEAEEVLHKPEVSFYSVNEARNDDELTLVNFSDGWFGTSLEVAAIESEGLFYSPLSLYVRARK